MVSSILIKYSIIIPTYNRREHLVELLDSITFCGLVIDGLEVIVVNDGSTDNTSYFLEQYNSQEHVFSFKYHNIINQGPAFARNFGASLALGKWLIFIDDDCLLPKSYFSIADKVFNQHTDIVAVSGHVVAHSNSLISKYIDWSGIMLSPYVDKNHKKYFVTANALIRKDIFIQLGGFDLSFKNASGEDVYFSKRILSSGYSIYFDKNLYVRHRHRDSIYGLFRTCSLYGKGHYQIDLLSGTICKHSYILNFISAASNSLVRIWRSKSLFYGFQFFIMDLIRSLAWTRGYKQAMNMNS